jgi:hypothetical protein
MQDQQRVVKSIPNVYFDGFKHGTEAFGKHVFLAENKMPARALPNIATLHCKVPNFTDITIANDGFSHALLSWVDHRSRVMT